MKKQVLLFILLFCVANIYAQKRNIFPAYSFDIGGEHIIGAGNMGALLVKESFNGGEFNATIDSEGINGNSLKVEVITLPDGGIRWDNAIKYFIEAFERDIFEIRFKAKADRATAFNLEIYNLHGEGNALLADRPVEVTEEVQEYIFVTNASTGHTIQRITLQFGDPESTEEGSIFYFDDLSIIKLNDDWDGNLVRNGNFDIPTLEECWIRYNQGDDHHVYEFDDTDALGSGQSLKITNLRKGADWEGNIKSYYLGNGTQYKATYTAKNVGQPKDDGNTKVGIGSTWDIGGECFPIGQYKGDGYAWQDPLTPTPQEIELIYDEAINRGYKNNHFIMAFGWYHLGDFWIDNVKVEQIGLTAIEIVNWGTEKNKVQLWINATPGSANNKVEWSIVAEESDGEGVMNEEGVLTVTKPGTITVKAVSTHKEGIETTEVIDCTDVTIPEELENAGTTKDPVLVGEWNEEVFEELALDYASLTTIDFTRVVGLTEVPEMDDLNPNCLVYITSDMNVEAMNVVVFEEGEGHAENITLVEGYNFNNLREFIADNITYSYNSDKALSEGWSSVCLPFLPDNAADVIIKAFTDTVVEEETVFVVFSPLAEGTTVTINTPYLVKVEAGGTALKAQNSTVGVSRQESVTHGDYRFTANYNLIPAEEAVHFYTLNGDGSAFYVGEGNSSVYPFSGYMESVSGKNDLRHLVVKHSDDIPVGIDNVTTSGLVISSNKGILSIISSENQLINIYSIEGSLINQVQLQAGENSVNDLPNGIYLINNQKAVVK